MRRVPLSPASSPLPPNLMKAYSLPFWYLVFVLPCLANIPQPGKVGPTQTDKVLDVGADTVTVHTLATAGYKITAIDNDGMRTTEGPKNVVTFHVSPMTDITVDGLPSKLSDVHIGMKIMVTSGMTPTDADKIVASTIPPPATAPKPIQRHGPVVAAAKGAPAYKSAFRRIGQEKVLSIQADRITVAQDGASKATAFLITPITAVTVNGQPATTASIQPGMTVRVTAEGENTAGSIEASDEEH
jgi:hypothetical protein